VVIELFKKFNKVELKVNIFIKYMKLNFFSCCNSTSIKILNGKELKINVSDAYGSILKANFS